MSKEQLTLPVSGIELWVIPLQALVYYNHFIC